MGVVKIEERCFGDGRLSRLGKALGTNDIRCAMGVLVFLWHDSQEMVRLSGTKEEIIDWCRPAEGEDRERIFQALLSQKYIHLITKGSCAGQFEIHGNKLQITTKLDNIRRAKKGGRALHDQIKRLKQQTGLSNNSQSITEGLKPAVPTLPYPTLPNPNQPQSEKTEESLAGAANDAEQPELIPTTPSGGSPRAKKPPRPPKAPAPTTPIWNQYATAYATRYQGQAPVRNAKINGQLTQLIARIGAEAAPEVAKFFVEHSDSYYVQRMHPVDLLLRDAEALHTQWKAGQQMTGTKAREIERREHNRNSFEQAFENLAAMGVRFAGT